jgi:hypothetical protein
MTNRRNFIKQVSAAGILSSVPSILFSQHSLSTLKISSDKSWACLLHLNYDSPSALRFNESIWNDITQKMVRSGMNMVVIDLGDAIIYKSHPEIAIKNAWTRNRLRNEIERLRKMGLEPIPKLNFSTGHDTWLGEYSRMISTEKYYSVCRDLISEVSELFDQPRFFHIGMDEETEAHQNHYNYVVIRQNSLWWNDFHFLVKEIEKRGSRAWIWSDYLWRHPEQFFERMPKSVVQSNWYYGESFDEKEFVEPYIKSYLDLEKYGYDQIPCGGYYDNGEKFSEKSIMNTVQFCKNNIADQRLLGFLQTLWRPTIEDFREPLMKGVDLFGHAKTQFNQ